MSTQTRASGGGGRHSKKSNHTAGSSGGGVVGANNNNNGSGDTVATNNHNKKSDHGKVDKEKIHSKPTPDQIRIAQITDISSGYEDPKLREKVAKLMETLQRSEEEVCCALSECDNDLDRAVIFLLETLPVGAFETSSKKKKKAAVVSNAAAGGGDAENGDWGDSVIAVANTTGGGASGGHSDQRDRSRNHNGIRSGRGGSDSRGWRGRETRENDRNNTIRSGGAGVGGLDWNNDRYRSSGGPGRGGFGNRGGGAGRGGRIGGTGANGPRGGLMRPGRDQYASAADSVDIVSAPSAAHVEMDNWDVVATAPVGGTMAAAVAAGLAPTLAQTVAGHAGVTEAADGKVETWGDWDNEEYTGSLADTKVFTPSAAQTAAAAAAVAAAASAATATATKSVSPDSSTVNLSDGMNCSAASSSGISSSGTAAELSAPPGLEQTVLNPPTNLESTTAASVSANNEMVQQYSATVVSSTATASAVAAVNAAAAAAAASVTTAQHQPYQELTAATVATGSVPLVRQPVEMPPLPQHHQQQLAAAALSAEQSQYFNSLTSQNSPAAAAAAAVAAHQQQAAINAYQVPVTVQYPVSAYGTTATATYGDVLATQQTTASQPAVRKQRARVPPPSKIPSSAVEMPGDSHGVGYLDVQFGGLDFGSDETFDNLGSSLGDKFATSTVVSSSPAVAQAPDVAHSASSQVVCNTGAGHIDAVTGSEYVQSVAKQQHQQQVTGSIGVQQQHQQQIVGGLVSTTLQQAAQILTPNESLVGQQSDPLNASGFGQRSVNSAAIQQQHSGSVAINNSAALDQLSKTDHFNNSTATGSAFQTHPAYSNNQQLQQHQQPQTSKTVSNVGGFQTSNVVPQNYGNSSYVNAQAANVSVGNNIVNNSAGGGGSYQTTSNTYGSYNQSPYQQQQQQQQQHQQQQQQQQHQQHHQHQQQQPQQNQASNSTSVNSSSISSVSSNATGGYLSNQYQGNQSTGSVYPSQQQHQQQNSVYQNSQSVYGAGLSGNTGYANNTSNNTSGQYSNFSSSKLGKDSTPVTTIYDSAVSSSTPSNNNNIGNVASVIAAAAAVGSSGVSSSASINNNSGNNPTIVSGVNSLNSPSSALGVGGLVANANNSSKANSVNNANAAAASLSSVPGSSSAAAAAVASAVAGAKSGGGGVGSVGGVSGGTGAGSAATGGGVVPNIPMVSQYIQTNVPFYQQPVYSYEDIQMIQQRMPPVPAAAYYDMNYQTPTSLSAGGVREPNYSAISDGRFARTDNNSSPVSNVPSTMSQQTGSGGPMLNLPYAYFYNPTMMPSGFQAYGTPAIYPQQMAATNASTGAQFPKPSYNSGYGNAGYDTLSQSAQDYNKGSYPGTGVGQPGSKVQSVSNAPPSATGTDMSTSMYSKNHSNLNKVNSYEKQTFHSGTPPPFNLAGTQNVGASSGQAYGTQQMYITHTMPSAHHTMNLHQPIHQMDGRIQSSSWRDSSSASQRQQSSSQGKAGNKPGFSPQNYWTNNQN